MFTQFIYFIVSLLVFSTYQKPDIYLFSDSMAIILFNLLFFIFISVARHAFSRLEQDIIQNHQLSHFDMCDRLTSRLMILALLFYTLDIYGLNLKKFFDGIPLLQTIPTLTALSFLALFFVYIIIIFYFEYNVYSLLHPEKPSRPVYIFSNLSFSLPMLLPWLFISFFGDMLQLLPDCTFKTMLSSTIGENIQFVFLLLVIAFFAPKIVKFLWRCKPLPDGFCRDRIDATCQKAGVQYANILYWPIFGGKMITAGVMGLTKKVRYILVTEALIETLTIEELESVIAHEIGHVKKKHLIKYFMAVLAFSFAIVNFVKYGMYFFFKTMGPDQMNIASLMFTICMIFFFIFYFRVLFGFFMRNFEREADIYAFQMIGSALPLVNAFKKITFFSGRPATQPNWHHFSIAQRIDYLERCEADPRWISHHDRKIKRGMIAYILGICLLIGISFQLPDNLENMLFLMHAEEYIQAVIEKEPKNAELYTLLGDAALLNKHYQTAIDAFSVSIHLAPHNATVLNNLAWLYATCHQKKLRNPEKALVLAQKAAELESSHYILDTLAEAYYINGYFEQAVRLAEKVMTMDLKNPEHYQKQLDKFKRAML
ncbi:MAG: M48 family metalloprotease [Candidatus Magnetomorum sp.]|nr:M48 family metalloprotease [Candidatus Magnetomorum sp.]